MSTRSCHRRSLSTQPSEYFACTRVRDYVLSLAVRKVAPLLGDEQLTYVAMSHPPLRSLICSVESQQAQPIS
jgi:hypothetical protein